MREVYFLVMQKRVLIALLSVIIPLILFAQQTKQAQNPTPPVNGNYAEKDVPPGTLSGLTDAQKQVVLEVINKKMCPCGCRKGSIIACRMKDDQCSVSRKLIASTVSMAKHGKTANEISAELTAETPQRPERPVASPVAMVPIREDDPSRGPIFAKVTIVEFSDFQCPFCGRAYPVIEEVMNAYPTTVRLVWKNQPLSFHANAYPSAEAAEGAREQGKFWDMYALMFTHQAQLSQAKYQEWAKAIGLDIDKFNQSIQQHRNKNRIDEDMKLADSVGVTGTPTFFINGKIMVGSPGANGWKNIIDQELKKADDLIKSGKKLDANFYAAIVAANKAQVTTPKSTTVTVAAPKTK